MNAPSPLPGVEKILLIAVAIVLFPTALFAGYLAYQAAHEGELFRTAPRLEGAESPTNGTFYRVDGSLSGRFAELPDFAPADRALRYQLTPQRVEKGDWVRDESSESEASVAKGLHVGETTIHTSAGTRFLFSTETESRAVSPDQRLFLRYTPVPQGPVVAFGVYRHGSLAEGNENRLTLLPASRQEEILAKLAQAGRRKSWILAGIAAAIALAGGSALWLARVGPREKVGGRT